MSPDSEPLSPSSSGPAPGLTSPVYLTPDQVADLLSVDVKTIHRWAKADPSMPKLQIGGPRGRVRFHRERLERWLRDREQGAPRMRRQTLSLAKPASGKEALRP